MFDDPLIVNTFRAPSNIQNVIDHALRAFDHSVKPKSAQCLPKMQRQKNNNTWTFGVFVQSDFFAL